MPAPILVTGATGYVGGRLVSELLERGLPVRALARDPSKAKLPEGVDVARGDVVSGAGLDEALRGVEVAYYLVHAMGRGNGPAASFAERDRQGARNFGEAAKAAGVTRVVYLGGLEGVGRKRSAHLSSREEVAQILADHVAGTVHVRAAMVIGDGSASFVMLRSLVERLPVMITPKWIDTKTQPVAIADVAGTLAALASFESAPAEVQLGGADVLSYGDMMLRLARILGKREPVTVRVPVLTPRLSSYWVGFVTPVEPALARPLVEGLGSEMIVRTPPPPGLNDDPAGFDDAVRAALA